MSVPASIGPTQNPEEPNFLSAVTIHNQLVRETPELAAELYEPQPNDFRGEQREGQKPYYFIPVFTEWEDRLFCRCIPPYILLSQLHEDAPRLTKRAKRGLERITELADEAAYHVSMELLPGDIQFINNYHVMHGRSAYSDDSGQGSVRHLKQLWLESRMLPSRPHWFRNEVGSHWGRERTASRLRPNV